MNDCAKIRKAIWELTHSFRELRLEPVVIELQDREQGEMLRRMLLSSREFILNMPHYQDPASDRVLNQIEVDGVIIRWPAEMSALRSGGFKYV